ncbi:hypothetical protein DPMN_087542 [Dreissena polymorpha]|uniref:Uncharacterized protein n=1 Tax=Dreissena polymorpha TaxID=45954 RepID=A0A9D4QWG7_DREPO|nr:hypothetical protein DPMN_087542 [Dreissena polymorpha]
MQYTYTTSCTNASSSFTSGQYAVCIERERGPGVAFKAGISFHPIGREPHPWQHGPVILTSHKPSTSMQGGVAPDVNGTTHVSINKKTHFMTV